MAEEQNKEKADTGQQTENEQEKAQETAEQEEAQETAETKEQEAAPGDGKEQPEEKGKGGFFKKKEDKEKTALKERVASLEDTVKRQMAEFDNYRKRTDKEKSAMFSMGEQNALEKMLPIADNFERALATIPEDEKGKPFASGMEMVYKQLMKQLEDLGVKPIEAVGKEFDPNFHNAVMQMESEELEAGMVGQELQKGYMYHDQVLRHSMVSVVK